MVVGDLSRYIYAIHEIPKICQQGKPEYNDGYLAHCRAFVCYSLMVPCVRGQGLGRPVSCRCLFRRACCYITMEYLVLPRTNVSK
jgi:hypothetical protein